MNQILKMILKNSETISMVILQSSELKKLKVFKNYLMKKCLILDKKQNKK